MSGGGTRRSSLFGRCCGVLLHPTSLPGGHGVGDLGPAAHRFLDFLVASKQSLWQVLPLNPLGFGSSPYASTSAFAGNPLLISLEAMVSMGLLRPDEVPPQSIGSERVDYGGAARLKAPMLRLAWGRCAKIEHLAVRWAFEDFRAQHASWLDDYSLFVALKEAHGGAPWPEWEGSVARYDPDAVRQARTTLSDSIDFHCFLQFVFHHQWSSLRESARARGIRFIGDLPIFVAHDSADVWAHRYLFSLDQRSYPTVVAGVPPDYFSPTGQRWGNPLYRWDRLADTGYAWWIARLRAMFETVDSVRVDHFRGFESYWEVPAEHATAQWGRWAAGPGIAFFDALLEVLGDAPIIVEDLGLITPAVERLREQLGYPGMKVLQFAFTSDAANPYLPHNYERNCVVYTATHDNDTTVGWYAGLSPPERFAVNHYAGANGETIAWDLIRLALTSVADTTIIPLQDVLGLDSRARMNFPGKAEGNWTWRMTDGVSDLPHERLAAMTALTGRVPCDSQQA